MARAEQLQQSREFIRHKISDFPQIMEMEPDTWWLSTVKMLISFKHALQQYPNIEIRDHFSSQVDSLLEMMREASHITPTDRNDFASFADHIIMDFSMEIALEFEQDNFEVDQRFVPITELVNSQPDRFSSINRTINSEDCIVLRVKHPTQDIWQEIPLPKDRKVWHKGGPARAVLDIVAHAPITMQESEFPWHDFDAIVGKKRKNRNAALNIGVDADGIEYMGSRDLDFAKYCAGRDTTQNQVYLGAEGLYFSKDAYETAVTGHTRIDNKYVANKAIYGFDKMMVKGVDLAKPRGLMRLVKAVVEGKALSFDHIPLNSCLDMGANTLFLVKRWSKKDNFPENLEKLFYLLKQMNQVREGENDIFDSLERLHKEFTFFDFDSEVRFPIEVVRWKSRKLVKQIDREMGWKFNIPTGLEVTRFPGDDIPSKVSLSGFVFSGGDMVTNDKWSRFLENSRQRTKIYQSKELSPYEKAFNREATYDVFFALDHDQD